MNAKNFLSSSSRKIILIATMFGLASCSEEKDTPDGKWDDIIKLSTKEVGFSHEKDSATITAEGDRWWINGMSIGDSTYVGGNEIDRESDSYAIKGGDCVVEKRDKHTLFVKVGENATGGERIVRIDLEAGDYFDYVTIKQAAN